MAGSEWAEMKIAQLRLDPSDDGRTLYCSNSNGRWRRYDGVGPAATVEPLLTEIERDPTGIFWG
ncbi:MAG: hypothetical protein QOD37_2629 [Gaiellales bacterium]|nr:hypothetical protein [Gaiellales bacterium]